MTKEQTPPLVSDERILNDVKLTVRATPNRTMEVKDLPLTAFQVRDIYELDRQKTREVVQALVDALAENSGRGNTPISSVMKADYAMNLAKSINIEPTK